MMRSAAPAYDDLMAVLPLPGRAKHDLVRRMTAPSRAYHNIDHLALLWSRHRRYGQAANLFDGRLDVLIALTIAYHDSIFVGGAADNESRSAALWLEVSAGAFEEADRLWVADTIRATADHVVAARAIDRADPRGHARQWVLDLDLTPLGETPTGFDDNMTRLAAEMSHLSEPEKQESLLGALRHFATARPLYRCREIATVFEAPARDNFDRYLPSPLATPRARS